MVSRTKPDTEVGPAPMTADEFRWIQRRLGVTTVFLSRYLGVSRTTLNYYRGGRQPIQPVVARLMRILDEDGLREETVRYEPLLPRTNHEVTEQ